MSKRVTWSQEDMQAAIDKCENEDNPISVREAARLFKVPKSTLARKVRNNSGPYSRLGRPPCIRSESEEDLVKYIKLMESRGYGLSRQDVRSLVFEYSERNGIKKQIQRHKPKGRERLALFVSQASS